MSKDPGMAPMSLAMRLKLQARLAEVEALRNERRKALAAAGVEATDCTIRSTDITQCGVDEKTAAIVGVPKMETKPLVPPLLAKIADAVGGFLALAAGALAAIPLIPQPAVFVVSALANVALFLAGHAAPSFPVGNALVPLALVPVLSTLAVAAAGIAANLSPGFLQGALLLAAALLARLAGKASPQPVVAV